MRLLYKILDHKNFNNPPTNINGVYADSGGTVVGVANLTLPGEFAFLSTGMQPDNGAEQNRRRQILMQLNSVTVVIS